MKLVDWYRRYYENPSEENAQQLFQAIIAYEYADFDDFQNLAWETRASFPTRDGKLKKRDGFSALSSGTINPPSPYDVGPNGWWWQRVIEGFVKNPTSRPHFLLMSNFHPNMGKFMDNVLVMRRFQSHHLYDGYLKVDPLVDLRKCISLLGDSTSLITLNPNFLMYWAKENSFVEYLVEAGVELCTTEFEAFYPSLPVHVNDNMIDWKTGVNFSTCRYGTKHFLPLFAMRGNRAYNLVNLHCDDKPVDDIFTIDPQILQCPCGRKFLSFDFVPHSQVAIRRDDGSIFYDLGIANQLQGQYQNFQFIQHTDGVVDVLYVCGNCCPMPTEDEKLIGQVLAGFDFKFKKDHYYTIDTTKFPVFHKNVHGRPYQQWPRRRPRYL